MTATSAPRIFYNQYQGSNIEGEAFIADHIFSYIVSGAHDVWVGDKLHSFQAGDYRFFRRNQLAKSIKKSLGDGFCSVSVHIDEVTLREIGRQYNLAPGGPHLAENVLRLKPGRYLERYVDSLLPYMQTEHALREHICQLKARELVLVLLDNNPSLANLLFDFSEPGKIDLQGFMNKHYRYNVTLDRFAFLTGRSLSGFKRDFARLYGLTPSRWLVRQRLLEAHYLIEEKGKRPSDIYLEIGFNDLSHFSYAYKKAFGNAPGKLSRS